MKFLKKVTSSDDTTKIKKMISEVKSMMAFFENEDGSVHKSLKDALEKMEKCLKNRA